MPIIIPVFLLLLFTVASSFTQRLSLKVYPVCPQVQEPKLSTIYPSPSALQSSLEMQEPSLFGAQANPEAQTQPDFLSSRVKFLVLSHKMH